MNNFPLAITGIGVIAPNGIGKEDFWQSLEEGKNAITSIDIFDTKKFYVKVGGQIKNFDPKAYLGFRGLRNLDRSTLFLLSASKQVIEENGLEINDTNTDKIGVCTATTFSHLWPIVEFDREVLKEGIDFASPALFPLTVINAPSSQVSIRFNIQGFNTTVSTGYTSGIEALNYTWDALSTAKAEIVLCGGVESLDFSLFFGFHKLRYMGGINGPILSCPFDKRRNGPLLGEGCCVFKIEEFKKAEKEKSKIFAKIRSVSSFFDGFKMGKIHPQGEGLKRSIEEALESAGILTKDVDYISSCANSSQDLDRIEVKVLKKIFGKRLKNIPVSSIKSMLGESFSVASLFQITSCIGVMLNGKIPPTINYKEKDPECDIDCVPNKAQKKEVNIALVTSFGPGGYNGACILEKYKEAG
ncbi:MAG: beta-ketoacyl-[acyl-carrier-protein] synthase family protein [Candidatus Omnitrophica bacterium]|nr:beta-ketoacyl-[acyl-carrier-protein] synthase family protein [Candidatus Omnitrophota bacterium]